MRRNGIGPGSTERREVSIKNALLSLAERFATLTEPKSERTEIISEPQHAPSIVGTGRFYAPRQRGIVLRQAEMRGPKGAQKLWVPTTEAEVVAGENPSKLTLNALLPLDSAAPPIAVGQLFEMSRLGTPPRSAKPFSICADTESLGNRHTPSLLPLATLALSNRMPGMLYVPEIPNSVDGFINERTNFKSAIHWKLPASLNTCVQAVERINAGEPKCISNSCEVPLTSRYTMRVRVGSEVVARQGLEMQFRSSSFYPSIDSEQARRLVEADLVDEASGLLEKVATQIQLP